ncbi:Nuclear protein localization protein 4, partial [Halocaridina rubra]
MIIRIQSTEGTKRVEVKPTESTKSLFEKVHRAFELSGFKFALYTTRDKKNEIVSSPKKTIKGCKLAHGDMIFMFGVDGPLHFDTGASPSTSHSVNNVNNAIAVKPSTLSVAPVVANSIKSDVIEDNVDKLIEKEDGKINRKKNAQ